MGYGRSLEYIREAEARLAAKEEDVEARLRDVQRREAAVAEKEEEMRALKRDMVEHEDRCRKTVEDLEARYSCSMLHVVFLLE